MLFIVNSGKSTGFDKCPTGLQVGVSFMNSAV